MIISRTPLRMSFVGGGSDLPSYYREYGGAVVSTAIDKFVYVTMNRKFDSGIRVAYSRVEEVNSVFEIEHQLVRAALNMVGVPGGVEITTGGSCSIPMDVVTAATTRSITKNGRNSAAPI